jgi:glycosyltransferase involved in cell wall biosynthesis
LKSASEVHTLRRPARETLASNSVALVSNALEPPPDEGIRKCAHELALVLPKKGVSIYSIPEDAPGVARKFLVSRPMIRKLRADDVRAVIYLPTQSATLGSLLRSAVLRSLVGAKVVLLALQPRDLPPMSTMLARLVRPDLVLTPSPSMFREAERRGLEAAYVQLGVDLDRFRPAGPGRKHELRRKYGLPSEQPIVLHVGHARRLRGLEWLVGLGADIVPLVVIGKSLGFDPEVVRTLRHSGVVVFDEYLPQIHEIYQLTDAYAFPVRNEQSAIGSPLSVLEAMACDVPLVTTTFGALPAMIREGSGVFFADDEARFRACLVEAVRLPQDEVRTRDQVLPYSWTATADRVLTAAKDLFD